MFGADLVKEIRAVERRFEHRGVRHSQILLYVHLHLGGGRGGEGDQGGRAYVVYDGTYASVLGSEIVAPLRYAVRLVDGIERYLDLAQKRHVVLLGERLGGEVQQFGLALQHVAAHLVDGRFVERRIEEMSYARFGGEGAHGVHLILHQGDERRYDDGDAVHDERRQLVAERFAAARGHEHESVAPRQQIADHRLLITLE